MTKAATDRWLLNPDNRQTHYERVKDWKKRFPERHKNAVLKCVHGITLDEFNQRLREQDFKCVICNKEFNSDRKPYVDHVHDETKRVRDLLCQQCNTLLGFAFDSVEILQSAIQYLKKHEMV